MKYFQFNKLVRDKIVKNMIKNGQKPVGERILSKKEYIKELKRKLKEEVEEFLSVERSSELKEELADVVEVIDYLMKELGVSKTELKQLQKDKVRKNGGFKEKIFLESVGVSEDNEWYNYYINNTDRYPLIKKN
jgi:predicted house-cleaning noncanonical NTP pyrophosphatase (MazG superfamily)